MYFYAPWCSFCKALAPQFAAASAQLKAMGNAAVMAKVDADSTPGGRALAARFQVEGFPTLIWFVNGRPQPDILSPVQDPTNLVFWVASKTVNATQDISDQVRSSPRLWKFTSNGAHHMQPLLLLAAWIFVM